MKLNTLSIPVFLIIIHLLCSPELVPHMTGGLEVPVLVTVNLSVRHCDATVAVGAELAEFLKVNTG